MYKLIKHDVVFEVKDTSSNHLWRFEIDLFSPKVDIYKNGKHFSQRDNLVTPFNTNTLMDLVK